MQRNKGCCCTFLRAFFISWEFLFLASGMVMYYAFPSVEDVIKNVTGENETLRWITLGPVFLFWEQLNIIKAIRNPDAKCAKVFHEWPDYGRLRMYCGISIFYSILSVLLSGAWIIASYITFLKAFFLMFLGLGLSLVSYLSCYSAKNNLEHILALNP